MATVERRPSLAPQPSECIASSSSIHWLVSSRLEADARYEQSIVVHEIHEIHEFHEFPKIEQSDQIFCITAKWLLAGSPAGAPFLIRKFISVLQTAENFSPSS